MVDLIERGLDLVHRGCIASAHEPCATRPEGIAGDHRDMLIEQQPLGELLARQPQVADLREDVECALRLESRQADLVQPRDDHSSPAVVFGDHLLNRRLAVAQRLQPGVLRHRRRGHDRVLMDFARRRGDVGGSRQPAQAPAGHRVSLGEAAQQHRSLAHGG